MDLRSIKLKEFIENIDISKNDGQHRHVAFFITWGKSRWEKGRLWREQL